MVAKAKLDVLENLPDIDMPDVNALADTEAESSLPALGERWAFNKLLLVAFPVLIVILLITGGLWFYLTRTDTAITKAKSATKAVATVNKKLPETAGKAVAQAPLPAVTTSKVYFKDFVIDLKDKSGKSKILLCDIAADVSAGQNVAELENRKDLRTLIYFTAMTKNAVALKSIDERIKLKKELQQGLNKILGDDSIKELYFTNYVIM